MSKLSGVLILHIIKLKDSCQCKVTIIQVLIQTCISSIADQIIECINDYFMQFASLQITHNNDSSEGNLSHLRNKHQMQSKRIKTDSYSALNPYC